MVPDSMWGVEDDVRKGPDFHWWKQVDFPGCGREKSTLWGESPVQFQADGPKVTFSIVLWFIIIILTVSTTQSRETTFKSVYVFSFKQDEIHWGAKKTLNSPRVAPAGQDKHSGPWHTCLADIWGEKSREYWRAGIFSLQNIMKWQVIMIVVFQRREKQLLSPLFCIMIFLFPDLVSTKILVLTNYCPRMLIIKWKVLDDLLPNPNLTQNS